MTESKIVYQAEEDNEESSITFRELIIDQILLLTDWNVTNIKRDPEQVRKNIETILILREHFMV